MKKINFIYLTLVFAALQSCTSDLDVVAEDSRILTSEQLFATPLGYKQALGGVYGNLSLTGTGDAGGRPGRWFDGVALQRQRRTSRRKAW